jgi:DNA-binding GntR family transcriptional regulator
LASTLRDKLAAGAFPGGRLPTEAELAEGYGVSRQTVRRALQDLVAEGLVERARGRGTFATGRRPGDGHLRSFGAIDELVTFAAGTTLEALEPLQRTFDAPAATRLGLPGEEVMGVTVRRARDGLPFCVTRVCVPAEIGRALLERGLFAERGPAPPGTIVREIDALPGHGVSGAHQTFTAESVEDAWGELIGVAPGGPVLRVERLFYEGSGIGAQFSVSHFNPERHLYRIELSRA